MRTYCTLLYRQLGWALLRLSWNQATCVPATLHGALPCCIVQVKKCELYLQWSQTRVIVWPSRFSSVDLLALCCAHVCITQLPRHASPVCAWHTLVGTPPSPCPEYKQWKLSYTASVSMPQRQRGSLKLFYLNVSSLFHCVCGSSTVCFCDNSFSLTMRLQWISSGTLSAHFIVFWDF